MAVGDFGACARRDHRVRDEEDRRAANVGEVNDKVDTLSKSVEENQERTRANEGRIGEVDQKAAAADQRRPDGRRSAPTRRTAPPAR